MTFDQDVAVIRVKDLAGLLHNLADDYLYDHRGDCDHGARYGSALLRLRRLARGQEVGVDDDMVETAEQFGDWMEATNR